MTQRRPNLVFVFPDQFRQQIGDGFRPLAAALRLCRRCVRRTIRVAASDGSVPLSEAQPERAQGHRHPAQRDEDRCRQRRDYRHRERRVVERQPAREENKGEKGSKQHWPA